MAIKPEADSSYFSQRPDERRLALALDESFLVTFGREFGKLSFWLAEPNKPTAERFGLVRELVVIYSGHPITDARALTALENVLRSPDFRHRIDKSVCLLVHSGDIQKTNDLLSNHTDRIIVPFHSSELLDPQKGSLFIRSRISKVVGQIDLFGMSSPITQDQYFFGRNELVQELVRRAAVRHQNTGLFGLRRTGKTSVLRAVERRLNEYPVLVEYVDCSNPGVHAARWWQVLEELARRVMQRNSHKSGLQPPAPGSYDQASAGARFLADMKAVVESTPIDRIVLMLDEIEYITSGLNKGLGRHWDSDYVPFWQVIRSTHQETLNKLVFLVAGVNPACINQPQFGGATNPIFELAKLEFLEPFDKPKVRDMVRSIGRYSGIDFDEATYSYLADKYGGHPFLIRIACSELWRAVDTTDSTKRAKIAISHFVEQGQEIRARLAQPIRDILLPLLWWYPDEYDVLQILSTGDSDFVRDYINEHPSSIIEFGKYGVLKKDQPGEFAIGDLKDFLILHGESYKRDLSPFKTSDIPAELLPEVPDLDKLTRLFQKRSEVEVKLRKIIMICFQVRFGFDRQRIANALADSIQTRADRRDPRALFVGREPSEALNELYTLDLKDIITKNWEIFSPLFQADRVRFEQNVTTLNIARRVDAHSKPFTKAEEDDFMNSYAWLLNCASKVD